VTSPGMPTAAAIDALLPQTQCTRCGYQGCAPYADAIAAGDAELNQCPPGGAATIRALASLTSRPALPLNPANGIERPPMVAIIDEARCIGCAKCLPPCPVDAIVGAGRYMHTVLVDQCTGCKLCIAPCPVDCITLVPRSEAPGASALEPTAADNRARYREHTARADRRTAERAALLAAKKQAAHAR
jgi:Na+-translocating ferredoxin:NAD+ oxidoreductase subunit B